MANGELKIFINQALHGYQNGHQLLAASTSLSLSAKRLLLFQSDLNGSIVPGFENYITGYPIKESNLYVFARTWYAPEMERPGCVWTHSLIIDFSDIGKLPDLSVLTGFFKRPKYENYDFYDKSIEFIVTLDRLEQRSEVSSDMKKIMTCLYEFPDKTCFLPQESSQKYEETILEIWNEQWPRLRRNFTFCTGALSLKSLDNEEYDLQVIPEGITNSINRQSRKPAFVNFENTEFGNWLSIFKDYDKLKIRKFLWTFGADIDGKRANYIPLLRLFHAIHSDNFDLLKISSYLNSYFPDVEKGKYLKKKLFGANSILPIPEKDLVKYLLSSDEELSLNINELQIVSRIMNLAKKNELTPKELVSFVRKIEPSTASTFWDKIDLPLDFAINLIESDEDLVYPIIRRWPEILMSSKLWTLKYSIQKAALSSMENIDINLWNILNEVITSGSGVIFDFRTAFGKSVVEFSLRFINENGTDRLNEEWIEYVVNDERTFSEWVVEYGDDIKRPIYVLIFERLSAKQIEYLRFEAKNLVHGYELIKEGATLDFINVSSCKLMSVGCSNHIHLCYLLVERTFPYIYEEISSKRIGKSIWKYISYEHPIKDYDDYFNPFAVFTYFQKSRGNNFEIENWDVGRQLIVKIVNQFVLNDWPLQSFASTFSGKKEFKEALHYCYSFENGTKHIRKLIYEIELGRIKLTEAQIQVMNKMLS